MMQWLQLHKGPPIDRHHEVHGLGLERLPLDTLQTAWNPKIWEFPRKKNKIRMVDFMENPKK